MSKLAIIIGSADSERLRTALVLATAVAAHDRSVAMFFQGEAVGLLRAPVDDPDAARQAAAGLPTLAQLVAEAEALGVTIAACQSSLALLGLSPADCHPHIIWGGMVGFVGSIAPDTRLVVA